MEEKDWELGEKKSLLKTRIFDVEETNKTAPDGSAGKFVSLKTPDWVKAVIKNTDTGKVVLVREYRHGENKWLYEFPSGTVEEGEKPEAAVLREVAEETGYQNGKIVEEIYCVNPNPAMFSNRMHCYYVEVSGKPEKQDLDKDEFINVAEVHMPEQYMDECNSSMDWLALKAYSTYKIMERLGRC